MDNISEIINHLGSAMLFRISDPRQRLPATASAQRKAREANRN